MPIFETQRVWRIEAFEADNRSWLFFFGRTGPPACLQCPAYICPETPAWSKTDRAADPYKPIPTNARTELPKRGRNAAPRSNALCGKELSRLRPRRVSDKGLSFPEREPRPDFPWAGSREPSLLFFGIVK